MGKPVFREAREESTLFPLYLSFVLIGILFWASIVREEHQDCAFSSVS